MNLNLSGKKVLVSGGTNGIGLSTAISFAKEGCDVAVFSRTQKRVDKTTKRLAMFSRSLAPAVFVFLSGTCGFFPKLT